MKRSSSIAVNLEEIEVDPMDPSWELIGTGGFGQVCKARHHQWGRDVAIKILFSDNRSKWTNFAVEKRSTEEEDAVREAELMRLAESPYVNKVLGVFKGSGPRSTFIHGLVMELMERGSLADLQKKHLLPWPLVVRLAHQVALGMNYLHSLTPALIHKNLKPANILLDRGLNVKITGFGLSKFVNTETSPHLIGFGTLHFTPPECFSNDDSETCAYDVYSYAILVWTILNPWPALETLSKGERPSLEYVNRMNVPGLEELMVRCWNQNPDRRPNSGECIAVTEGLYEKNRHGINDAVCQVLNELDQQRANAVEQAQVLYVQRMKSVRFPTNTLEELSAIHASSEREALELFLKQKRSFKFRDYNQEYQKKLVSVLQGEYNQICEKNFNKSRKACELIIKQVFKPLEDNLEAGLYRVPGGYKTFCQDLQMMTDKYNHAEGRGVKAVEVLKTYLDEMAVTDNALKLLSEAQRRAEEANVEQAQVLYVQRMKSVRFPTNTLEELSTIHASSEREALLLFMKHSLRDDNQEYQKKLVSVLQGEYNQICEKNFNESRKACERIIKQVFKPLEDNLEAGLYRVPGGYETFCQDLQMMTDKYNHAEGRGVKAVEVLKTYLDEMAVTDNALKLLSEAQRRAEEAVDQAQVLYVQRMKSVRFPTNTPEELSAIHASSVREALELFMKHSLRDDNQEYQKKLVDDPNDQQRVVTDFTTSRKEDVKDAYYSDGDVYKFTSKTAGLCVIINNKNFDKSEDNRTGTDYDAAELARTFTRLGFRVVMCEDKRKDQMLNILGSFSFLENLPELQKSNVVEWSGSGQKFTDLKDLPRHGDAFVCCILSHGDSEGVRGTDGRTIPIRDIIRPFNSKTCPALLNKPKLFFIQACRGSGVQEAENFVNLDSHVKTPARHSYSIPEYADYFIGFSTIDQYAAARKDDGSWYIQTLCNQLQYGCPKGYDILRILTRVTDEVCKLEAKLKGGEDFKQSPDSMNTLRRLVVFRPI